MSILSRLDADAAALPKGGSAHADKAGDEPPGIAMGEALRSSLAE
jgi:hypothetical protein